MLSFKIPGNIYHLPYSTMANKNLFASLLFLMVPLVFFGLSLKGIWSILHVFTLSIATLNIVLTQTRAVYLAVGICILCLILWYGMYNYFDKLKRFNIPWQYKIGIVIIAFSIAFASLNQSIFHGDASILQTFNTVADFSDQSIHQRLVMWKNSLLMVKDHPLNGVGINNWQIEFPKYGLREMSVPVQQGEVHFQRPHNDFLWVMSESGVLGFFAYIAIFIFSISCCFKIILSSQSQHDHFLVIALICQVIGFSVISFFDFPKERIEHLVYFGFVLSMVNHYSYKYNVMTLKVSRTWVTSVIIALSTGILIAVYIGNSRLKSEIYMRNALNARALENWNGVIDYIDKARTPFFALDLMSTPLSWYSGVAYFSKNEIATAHQNFLEAYRIHPYHLHVLNNLATCEQLSNNPNKALELYLKALQISPSFEPSLRNLSVVYYNKGLYEEAYSTIRQCNQNDTLAMQYSDIIKSKLHIQ
jgi:O-antigen ligase